MTESIPPCKHGHDAHERYRDKGGHLRCRACNRANYRNHNIRAGVEVAALIDLPSGRAKGGGLSRYELRALIEQAIARGEDEEWIVTNLNVTLSRVHAVMRAMDAAAYDF